MVCINIAFFAENVLHMFSAENISTVDIMCYNRSFNELLFNCCVKPVMLRTTGLRCLLTIIIVILFCHYRC